MVKVKKKKLAVTKESSGFRTTSISSVKKRVEEEKQRRSKTKSSMLKLRQGHNFVWVLPPTSEKMDGQPFVFCLEHNDLGVDEKGFGNCMRRSMEEPRANCLACRKSEKYWKRFNTDKSDETKELAKKFGAQEKALVQVLDVSAAYNKAGQIVKEFPKCFGKNLGVMEEEDYVKGDKCTGCKFLQSCQKGPQAWKMQFGAQKFMVTKMAEESVDPCNPEAARPLKIIREGEGFKTKYTTELADTLVVPPHVVDFAEKNALDLFKFAAPSTEEQMRAMLASGTEVADDDDDDLVPPPKTSSKSEKTDKSGKSDYSKEKVGKPTVTKEQRNEMISKLKASAKLKKMKGSDKHAEA